MLEYAASRQVVAARPSSPSAMLMVVGVHIAVIAAVMSVKMDLPQRIVGAPLIVDLLPADPEPRPEPLQRVRSSDPAERVIEPSLVAKGEVLPTYYDPNYDGEKYTETRQMRGLDIKTFPEFYKAVKGKEPEGELWEVYKRVIALNGAMQRMIVLQPSAPPEAAAALRAAVRKLNAIMVSAGFTLKALGNTELSQM